MKSPGRQLAGAQIQTRLGVINELKRTSDGAPVLEGVDVERYKLRGLLCAAGHALKGDG
jgi:hypothetical protein